MAKKKVALHDLPMEDLLKRKRLTTVVMSIMAMLFVINLAFVASFPLRGRDLSSDNLPSVIVAVMCVVGALPSYSLRKSIDHVLRTRESQ